MRVSRYAAAGWLGVPALIAAGLTGVAVPAHAAALPSGCSASGNTITCEGSLQKGDVVEGTSGDDTIVIKGDVPDGAIVRGLGGNDTITAYDVGEFKCAGKAALYSKHGGLIDGGDGDDTITVGGGQRPEECTRNIEASEPEIPIRPGNVAEYGKVLGGSGNDKITVGSAGYVSSDKDDPSKSLEALGGRIDGGDGDDIIDVGWVATGATFEADAADGVYGGDGADTIHAGNVNGLGRAYGGPGPDTITVDGMNTGYVQGDDGDDKIFATKGTIFGLAKLLGNRGNDEITVKSLTGTAEADGGDGDDIIKVTSINGPDEQHPMPVVSSASVNGGNGNDTISVELIGLSGSVNGGLGNDTITVKSLNGPEDELRGVELKFHNAIVQGNDGDDRITVGTVGKFGRVWGDSFEGSEPKGKDTIKVTTVNGQAKIRGGPLADRITVTDINGKQAVINGEGGNDMITVTGKNAGTVIGGAGGKDTCKAKGAKKTCELPAKK